MPIFQPTDPGDAARRTLSFINRSCFVHHLANARPLPNLRITPKEGLTSFHGQLQRLVVSLSNALIIDNPIWHHEIAEAVAGRMMKLIAELEKPDLSLNDREALSIKLRTLRTIFAVLKTIHPNN